MVNKSPARNWLLRYGSLSLENDLNSRLFTHNLTPVKTPHWQDKQEGLKLLRSQEIKLAYGQNL